MINRNSLFCFIFGVAFLSYCTNKEESRIHLEESGVFIDSIDMSSISRYWGEDSVINNIEDVYEINVDSSLLEEFGFVIYSYNFLYDINGYSFLTVEDIKSKDRVMIPTMSFIKAYTPNKSCRYYINKDFEELDNFLSVIGKYAIDHEFLLRYLLLCYLRLQEKEKIAIKEVLPLKSKKMLDSLGVSSFLDFEQKIDAREPYVSNYFFYHKKTVFNMEVRRKYLSNKFMKNRLIEIVFRVY